jgi:hypothetical protein
MSSLRIPMSVWRNELKSASKKMSATARRARKVRKVSGVVGTPDKPHIPLVFSARQALVVQA